MRGLPRLAGRPFGRLRETLIRLLGAARDEPVRWPQVAKAALATGVAWELALLILPGKAPPVFAPLAAMLSVQVTAYESLRSAVQRSLGVIAGVLLSYLLSRMFGLHWWSIALVVLVALALGQALALGNAGSTQVPVSALLVLGVGAATSSYAYTRVLETILGAAVGATISLVVAPPLHLDDSGRAVRRLAEGQAALLRDIAEGLRAGWPGTAAASRLTQARALDRDLRRAQTAVERVGDSVRLNPRGRRVQPAAALYREELDALQHVQVQVRGIARALADEAARAAELERVASTAGPSDPAHTDPSLGIVPGATAAESAAVTGTMLAELRTAAPGAGGAPAPPEELRHQLARLLDLVATALTGFGSAAMDDEGRAGSAAALNDLRQRLATARRLVRDTIRTARAVDLAPATWLVVGSMLTDLRRVLAELETDREVPVNVPIRPRRVVPQTPRLPVMSRSRARRRRP